MVKKNIYVKDYFKSKTFWVSVLGFVSGFCVMLQNELLTGASISVMSVIMLVLRYYTQEGITFK